MDGNRLSDKKKVSFIFLVLAFLSLTQISYSAIDLSNGHWKSTFNCSEWEYPDGSLNCDGIDRYGGYSVIYNGSTHYEEVILDANNPSGEGGRGQRHYIGYGSGDGNFIMTGGLRVSFPQTYDKLWIRWYQRWESGFTSNWHTFKTLFFRSSTATREAVFHTSGTGSIDLNPPDYGTTVSNVGYGYSFYPTGISDGSWQAFEMHLDIPNNVFRSWINGQLVANNSNVDFTGVSPFQDFLLPSNSRYLDSQVRYIDFDDISIYVDTPPNTDSSGNPFIGLLDTQSCLPESCDGMDNDCDGLVDEGCNASAINLSSGFWETTFDCDTDGDYSNGDTEWLQYSDALVCDGISKKGAWTTSDGRFEQIIGSANNPDGKGGKGQRHWVGDGTNINSGSIQINLDSPRSEIWFRWYQRWESGFTSDWHTFKNVWFEGDDGTRHIHRTSPGQIDIYSTPGLYYTSGVGYGSDYYIGGISDGTWHAFEVHLDIDSKIWEVWVDGVKKVAQNNVDYGNTSTITHIVLPENVKDVSNGRSMYIDFDDLAISTHGYIGLINSIDLHPSAHAISPPDQHMTNDTQIIFSCNASDDNILSGIKLYIDDMFNTSVVTSQQEYAATFNISLDPGSYSWRCEACDNSSQCSNSSIRTLTVADEIIPNQHICGDGACNGNENSSNCLSDCGYFTRIPFLGDTYLNNNTINYANSSRLNTYTWPVNTSVNAIILKINTSSIENFSHLSDAYLGLYLIEESGDQHYDISAHRIINHDPIMNLTTGKTYDGTNNWTIPIAQADISSPIYTNAVDTTLGLKIWNITDMIRFWHSDPSLNYGLLLNSDPIASQDSYRFFASLDNPNSTIRPRLIIKYGNSTEDSTGPYWSSNAFGVPLVYSPILSYFNISWFDPSGVDTVLFESNISGTAGNHSMVGSGNYSYSSVIGAGSYYWTSYANDSFGNANSSDLIFFSISRSNHTLHMEFNGSEEDSIITYPQSINVTAWLEIDEGDANLYKDGTLISNPFTSILSAGIYNFTYSYDQTQNYTSASITRAVTVLKRTPMITLSSDNGWRIRNSTSANISCYSNSEVTLDLYINGSLTDSGKSVWNSSSYAQGIYDITCNSSSDDNHSYSSTSKSLEVFSKNISSCSLSFSPSSQIDYGEGINVSCSCTTPDRTANLYRDGVNITDQIGSVSYLPAGQYDYVCNVSESVNWTGATSSSSILTVDRISPNLTLSVDSGSWNVTYGKTTNVSCSSQAPKSLPSLFRNWTYVGTFDHQVLDIGTYNYTCNVSETENHTAQTRSINLVVNPKNPSYCIITASPSSNQSYGNGINVSCTCSNPESPSSLYRDGIDISDHNHLLTTLAAGTYNYTCNTSETQNYTSANDSTLVTISKADSVINLSSNGFSSSVNAERGDTLIVVSEMVKPSVGPFTLHNDGMIIRIGFTSLVVNMTYHQVGSYNISAVFAGNSNYSSTSSYLLINVSDTIPPNLTSINVSGISDSSAALRFSTSEESNHSLYSDNISISSSSFSNSSEVNLTGLSPGSEYTFAIKLCDSYGNCRTSQNISFMTLNSSSTNVSKKPSIHIDINWSLWNRSHTTNLSEYGSVQLQNISNVTFHNGHGSIRFIGSLNITSNISIMSDILITRNNIFVNSSALPMFNKSSILRFFNVSFESPRILKDGIPCSSSTCTNYSYNRSQKIFSFNVDSFSEYSIEESPTCSDGIQNQDESGIDCGAPCNPCDSINDPDSEYDPDQGSRRRSSSSPTMPQIYELVDQGENTSHQLMDDRISESDDTSDHNGSNDQQNLMTLQDEEENIVPSTENPSSSTDLQRQGYIDIALISLFLSFIIVGSYYGHRTMSKPPEESEEFSESAHNAHPEWSEHELKAISHLSEYINNAFKNGQSLEIIVFSMQKAGWKKEMIIESFKVYAIKKKKQRAA